MSSAGLARATEGPSMAADVAAALTRKYQHLLDKTTTYPISRWSSFIGFVCLYGLRVWSVNGWFIVTYGLGIYLLNLFIGFLTPQVDPETEVLPTKQSDAAEFKPFNRKLPEFKFWKSAMTAVVVAFFMTFFSMFDIPVFWPILLMYFIVLFVLTMKNQISHMIKHRYIPFSFGKKKYAGKPAITKQNIIGEARFTGSNIK